MTIIREATAQDAAIIAKLHGAATQEGYRDFADADSLQALVADITPAKWTEWLTDNTKALIAFHDDDEEQAAGFIAFGPIRTRIKEDRGIMPSWPGEIYALYVHPAHWGEDVARQLMVAASPVMRKHYWDKALLWVIEKNKRAIAFYEKMGGQRVSKKKSDIGGQEMTELAFGWKDITRIK